MSAGQPLIFLASNLDESRERREHLLSCMQSAGLQVTDLQDKGPAQQEIAAALAQATCSVHVLSSDYGQCMDNDPALSVAKYQFLEARKKLLADPSFKMFIWYPPEVLAATKDPRQEEFINEI